MHRANTGPLTGDVPPGLLQDATTTASIALTPGDIAEFRAIVHNSCGIEFTDQEAWNRAIELIALVRMLVKPYPEDECGRVQTSSDLPA